MANLFQRLISLFNKPLNQSSVTVGLTATYPSVSQSLYVQIYNQNASVYTIVLLMARKFATLPRYLTEIEDDGAAEVYKRLLRNSGSIPATRFKKLKKEAFGKYMRIKDIQDAYGEGAINDTLSQLLEFPNEQQGHDSFYQLIYTYKKLTGNAYEWLNRGGYPDVKGKDRLDLPIIDRWVLPSHIVYIQVDRSVMFGRIVSYSIYTNAGMLYFEPEDVIHWKDPNPIFDMVTFSQFYGLSPLQPGMPLIVQDTAGRDAMVAMYQNGGARGVLSNPTFDNLSKEQNAAVDQAINTKINNRDYKSAVAALPGSWEYVQMGETAVDMQLVDAQDKVFQRIANLLGCNPQLFETKTTFNNVEQARKDLITNSILPDACSFRDEENRIFLQAFGLDPMKYRIEIDVSDIHELQEDMAAKTTSIMSNWTLSNDEKREELGFDPMEDPAQGALRFIPTTFTTMEDASLPAQQLDPGTDNLDSGDQISDLRPGSTGNGNPKTLPLGEVHDLWRKASLRT